MAKVQGRTVFTRTNEICAETEKAILIIPVDVDGERWKKAVWLPKSQVRVWEERAVRERPALLIKAPCWLLARNELDKWPAPKRGMRLVAVVVA